MNTKPDKLLHIALVHHENDRIGSAVLYRKYSQQAYDYQQHIQQQCYAVYPVKQSICLTCSFYLLFYYVIFS